MREKSFPPLLNSIPDRNTSEKSLLPTIAGKIKENKGVSTFDITLFKYVTGTVLVTTKYNSGSVAYFID
jgi:hypothetical protein